MESSAYDLQCALMHSLTDASGVQWVKSVEGEFVVPTNFLAQRALADLSQEELRAQRRAFLRDQDELFRRAQEDSRRVAQQEGELDMDEDELSLQRDMYLQLQEAHQVHQRTPLREEIRENVLRAALERQRRAQRFTLRRRAHW